MLFPDRTDDGKVALYHRATGERLVRWPVDARDLMESGQYAIDPPTDHAQANADASPMSASTAPTVPAIPVVTPTVDPVPHVTAAMQANAGMTPIGAPLVVDTRVTAGPAMPMKLPSPGQRASRGKR